MIRYTRRAAIAAALTSFGCGPFRSAKQQIVTGNFPTSEELLSARNLSLLKFHQRTERPTPPEVVDLWADAGLVVDTTAVVRYGYRREAGIAEPLRLVSVCCDLRLPLTSSGAGIAKSFMMPFAVRAPQLTGRLDETLKAITANVSHYRYRAFKADPFVGEVEVAFRPDWQNDSATIGFYDIIFHRKELEIHGGPLPEALLPTDRQAL